MKATEDQCPAIGSQGNNYDSQQAVPIPTADNTRWHTDTETGMHSINADAKESDVQIKTAQQFVDSNSHAIHNGGMGFVVGLLMPLVVVMCLVLWVFYAYRNPHTKSGQLLIQVS